MIHPKTRLQYINDVIGYGLFATDFIPMGTIVYVKDSLEREITPEEYRDMDPEMQQVAEKYSYIDERGVRIVSWDFAKYVNHCCHCNTISTGYGFEMAIRDIQPDEQITDEYGIFNLEWDMQVECDHAGCRCRITNSDFDRYYPQWDEKIRKALPRVFDVEQPLLPLVADEVVEQLIDFMQDNKNYRSVYELRYRKPATAAEDGQSAGRRAEASDAG